MISNLNRKHGLTKTRLHVIWNNMIARCYNPNNNRYKHYGGRGIIVCDEWLGEHGFENFYKWAMENGYADDLSIDRIDVNGNYEPDNCRWATMEEQANNKRNTKFIEYKGEKLTTKEASKKYNIKQEVLTQRLRYGWSVEDALERPVISPNKSPKRGE